jgi:sterol desaturase/sphingolipid hydroxylase (fatty acid hydroxylase superfamily)
MKPGKLAFVAVAGGLLAGLLIAERKRPLRRQSRPALPRNLRNAALGASSAAVVAALEFPLTEAVARANLARRRGLAQQLPRPLRLLAGIAAIDYGFYWWHVATHKVPFLWRFHRVHHVDPDMDASTAVRFHFVDMLVSLPGRLVQVLLAGASPKALRYWRHFFHASVLFHHSNLRLPGRWDERLSWLLTTPRMHGIHHSKSPDERNSNWTSGFSLWDRLHGTFRDDVAQRDITIGVDDAAAESDVGLLAALAAPISDPSRKL